MSRHSLLAPTLLMTVLAAPLAVSPAPTFAATVASAEAGFASAREAFRNGERVRLGRAVEALAGHPLQAWAEHWQLKLQIDDGDDSRVPAFLARHAGTWVAERLRAEWLRALGKKAQWDVFRREWPLLSAPDAELGCLAQQAAATPAGVRAVWLSAQDLPEACKALVDQLVEARGLSVGDVWERVRRLMEAKKPNNARLAAAYLPATEGYEARAFDAAADHPARYLDKLPADFAKRRGGREAALAAVGRLARGEPAEAAARFARIEGRFEPAERAYGWGQIAMQGAMRHLPASLDWYRDADHAEVALSDDQLAWWARAALRSHDWAALHRAVERMPAALAAQPDWIYWLGRAHAAQGRRDEARALWLKIAGQPNFYGNLADEELGQPIVVPPRATAPTREEIDRVAANPAMQRALALLRADLRLDGVKEWSYALRGLDDRQLLAAAEHARRQDVFDRAIAAADRTSAQHDFNLRYLAPFREQVEPKARELALDGGWVYGLMRQESRFVMDARSSVGAKGLMQLMPATAKYVAKKINMAHFHPGKVTDMDVNVTLGTHYLKMVLDSLDNHPVLASAAYNAGPGRARRWRSERPLEGAIYAETIPFNETRDYVKKVMSNAVYYSALFEGKPQSLKARLGMIGARGQGERGVEDLP